MTKRNRIEKSIGLKMDKIKLLRDEIIELRKKAYLLSDKEQWFTEKEETIGRGKNAVTRLVGRIHWRESFTDDDTGKIIRFERSEAVRINGEWIC